MPLIGGLLSFAAFLLYEARASHPMLPLELFRRRNFAVGNIETLSMYAGLSLLFFFLVLFLQNAAGYSAVAAGSASLPVTIVMFLTSMRFGAMADRFGPRFFMGVGPIVAGLGMALLTQLEADLDYVTDLLPALLIFSLGLSMTVAPLTATVLADADEHNAGSRAASTTRSRAWPGCSASRSWARSSPRATATPPTPRWAPSTWRWPSRPGWSSSGGVLGLIGIRNPRREVECADCPGGQLVGSSAEAARHARTAGGGSGGCEAGGASDGASPDRGRLGPAAAGRPPGAWPARAARRRRGSRRSASASTLWPSGRSNSRTTISSPAQMPAAKITVPSPNGRWNSLAVGALLEQREHRHAR